MIEYYKNFSLENLFYIDENGIVQEEEWRKVVKFELHYEISNLGRLKSLGNNKFGIVKILKQSFDKYGYLAVALCVNGKIKRCTIHRLVALAFIPNMENKPTVNHKDENGTKWHNVIWNLEWATISENTIHAVKNKLKVMPKGELSTSHKLTDEEVFSIRKEYPSINKTNLAKKYNVSRGLIYLIINNKRRVV